MTIMHRVGAMLIFIPFSQESWAPGTESSIGSRFENSYRYSVVKSND